MSHATFPTVNLMFCALAHLLITFLLTLFFFKRYKISVYRRYSDFDVFHEVLLQRFSYRVVPAMPPKRMLKGGKLFFFQRLSF